MRRAGFAALVVAFAAGLAAAVAGAARAERPNAFSLGTLPVMLLAVVTPENRVCQTPVAVPDPMEAVQVVIGPAANVRGPVRVTVREPDPGYRGTGRVLAQGTMPRRELTGHEVTFELDRPVPAERFVSVCVDQDGREPIELWGDTEPRRVPATSGAVSDGRDMGGDLFMRFPDPDRPSLLERIPAAFRHAAPFKLGGIGAWTFWLIAGLLVVGGPLVLGRSLLRADADDRDR